MKWITDRKRDLALLEAHQNLVDTLRGHVPEVSQDPRRLT